MDEILATLRAIGIPQTECEKIKNEFDGDMDALSLYYLYCRAMYDDRREYVS